MSRPRGLRLDRTPWSPQEDAVIAECAALGWNALATASHLNATLHQGRAVRSEAAISNRRTKLGIKVATGLSVRPSPTDTATEREQEVETIEREDGLEAKAVGTRIKTIEDLLAYINADMTKWEVASPEATKWESVVRGPSGVPRVVEMHRVFVKLKPKLGPNVFEQVEAMIAGAVQPRRAKAPALAIGQHPDLLQALVIADPHVAKYAWDAETGQGDYDTGIACELLRETAGDLIARGDHDRVGRRAVWVLGDFFHYDSPAGTTTGGTPLDRDGRLDKMLREGTAALFDIIEWAARKTPVEVVVVPGNHDEVLSVTLRHILAQRYRQDGAVTVDASPRARRYVTHGKCLFSLVHGDKRPKELGKLMSVEESERWGQSAYREVHHGHKHTEGLVEVVGGVTVRQHLAICPPDGWHYQWGYLGAPRGMDALTYHADGRLVDLKRATVRSRAA